MSDAPAATPAKAQKKKAAAKPKKPSSHPKYSEMVQKAIADLKERGGSSRQAILKYILKDYDVGKEEKTVNAHLKMALRAGVKNGSLKQSKGTGASGSFRIGEKTKAKKPAVAKKPAAKPKTKAKNPIVAKKASPKKKAAKKAVSPKKVAAKKPAAKKAKVVKKAASPKKTKKPAAKKPAAKKPAAKKAKKSPKKAAKK